MITRHSLSPRTVAAAMVALQIAATGFLFAQTSPPPVPKTTVVLKAPDALRNARAAMKAGKFAEAHAQYRAALKAAPRTGPLHDEALRGFS
jgi:hypothetical protein